MTLGPRKTRSQKIGETGLFFLRKIEITIKSMELFKNQFSQYFLEHEVIFLDDCFFFPVCHANNLNIINRPYFPAGAGVCNLIWLLPTGGSFVHCSMQKRLPMCNDLIGFAIKIHISILFMHSNHIAMGLNDPFLGYWTSSTIPIFLFLNVIKCLCLSRTHNLGIYNFNFLFF